MAIVNRWMLTSNANDSVGSFNMTNVGGITFSSDGASLNGSTQYFSSTSQIQLPSNCTFSLWVYPTETVAYNTFISNQFYAGGTNQGWGYRHNAGYFNSYNAYSGESLSSAGNLDNNTLCFLEMKINSGNMELWKNGVYLGNTTALGTVNYADTRFHIGGVYSYGGVALFKGKIADVRYYNNYQSSANSLALYAAGPNDSFLQSRPSKRILLPNAILSTSIAQR